MEVNADLRRPQALPTSKENRHLKLAVASSFLLVELLVISSYFLVAIMNDTLSAVIQQGGRVGLLSVPHDKLVAYKSYN